MEEKDYKKISVEDIIKELDEMFNIKNFEQTDGQSYRIGREYHIHESEVKRIDTISKLLDSVQGKVIVEGEKTIICEIIMQNVPEGYTLVKLS